MNEQQEQAAGRPVRSQAYAHLVECVVWQKSRNMVADRRHQKAIHVRAMRPQSRGLVLAGVRAKGVG